MSLPPKSSIILLALLLSAACVSPEEANVDTNTLRENVNTNFNTNAANANANTAQDDEIRLNEIINLPYEPEENVWRKDPLGNANDRTPGPTDFKLTVVLRFSDEDAEKIVKSASEKNAPFETKVETESWFPAELIAKSDASGDSMIEGSSYSAAEFIKSPYNNGSLVRIDETNYFVLRLQTS